MMIYWDIDEEPDDLETTILKLAENGKDIVNVTIMEYRRSTDFELRTILIPIRALIIYK